MANAYNHKVVMYYFAWPGFIIAAGSTYFRNYYNKDFEKELSKIYTKEISNYNKFF